MELKKFAKFIDLEIKKNFKSRRAFAQKTNRNPNSFNKTLSECIEKNKKIEIDNLESILKDLGYELAIQKKEPTEK